MEKDKAYKILAEQKNISNKKAKELIDKGLVYIGNNRVKIARALINLDTKFRVEEVDEFKIIYEDDNIIAVDKPSFVDSYDIADSIDGATLIHRLDRDTSGILLLSKSEEFLKKVIREFQAKRVIKRYIAWIDGVFYKEIIVDAPIITSRKGRAISRIDKKRGAKALSIIKPLEIHGKKSKVLIEIVTGRTHQIRIHLAHIGHPIIGDELYGSYTKAKRVLLHAYQISLLGYSFTSKEPKEIYKYK
jgi:23S rRNA pseudouridine1911/1915/1917 synthase